jgi:hypothetical protein
MWSGIARRLRWALHSFFRYAGASVDQEEKDAVDPIEVALLYLARAVLALQGDAELVGHFLRLGF